MSLDADCVNETLAAQCEDWFLTGSSVYGDSGQGLFWELFQQASLLNDKLQDIDPDSETFSEFYAYCCSSMNGLLEIFTRAIDDPLVVSSFESSDSESQDNDLSFYVCFW